MVAKEFSIEVDDLGVEIISRSGMVSIVTS